MRRLSLCLLILCCLPMAGPVVAQDGGVVVGRVLDPTGESLAAAEVRVQGTTLVAITDAAGRFRLSPVPLGDQRLVVEFIGYPTATQDIQVSTDVTTNSTVTLAWGEVLTVDAQPLLSGQAKALNQQKNAINITNIIAADQIGRFPDPNAAEAAQRIPAVTLQRDQGEGRYVQVRGTESRLNSMTINGERIPAPEGDRRDIALDVVPADLLEAIEVSKALTPDMDGDAIGGTVNLVTKRAPENPRLAATLGAGYNEIADDSISSANFTWGRRFGGDNGTGLVLSASALETHRGSDNFEVEYDDGFVDDLQLRDYTIERQRYGLTADLDRRLGDGSDVFLRGIWNRFDDQEARRRARSRIGDETIEREVKDRFETQEIHSLQLGGTHLFGSKALLEYRLSWSESGEDEPGRLDSTFVQEDVIFQPNVAPDSIDPNNIRSNPANENLAAFELDEVVLENNLTEDEDMVGRVDLSLPFYRDAGFSGMWKMGAKARIKDKTRDINVFELDIADLALLDILDTNFRSPTPFFNGRYDVGSFHDLNRIRQLASGADRERDIEEDLADYRAEEDTVAAYGLVELQLDKLTFLGGLRWEQTDTTYDAFELIDGNDALTSIADDDSYDEWLPMLHVRYALSDNSNVRAALTRTLSRANFEDLAPFLFEEDEERERGNPELELTTAWNLDLMYERYLGTAGIFAFGAFYKELDDNIFTFTFDEIDGGIEFETTQPRNADGAELLGLELAYQNRFSELPGAWDGLGLYFNVTWTDSEADFPDRPSTRLQGQAETVGNLALSYEKGGFSGRLSLNYNSEYLLEIGSEAAADIYIDEHVQLDFSASQRLTDRLRLFVELINLTDEPLRVYEGFADRPIQEEVYSWWGTIGIKVDF